MALWVRDYNANAIKHVDSRIQLPNGDKFSRDELWQTILRTPEALVRLPEEKVCRWFLTGSETTRQVNDNLISFVHPEIGKSRKYNLGQWAEFYSQKDKVRVSPLLMADGAIRVEIEQLGKDALVVQVEPERDWDAYGREMSNPVIGEEYRPAKHTVAENAAKEIARTAYGDVNLDEAEALLRKNVRPFQHFNEGKGVIAHSHLGQGELPERLLPKAQELNTPALAAAKPEAVELKRMNHAQMANWLRGMLKEDYDKAMLPELMKRFPDGATELELEAVLADLRAGRSAAGRAKLTVIGG